MAANSRYPSDEFAKRAAQQTERRLKMLEEAMTRTPKKEPTPTLTSGIIGLAEVDSIASTVKHSVSGFDNISVRYEAPWDFGIEGMQSAGEFCTVTDNELHLEGGEYEIACRFSYGWANGVTPPPAVQVALVNVNDASDAFYNGYDQMFPVFTQADGKSGICPIVGPFGRTIVAEAGAWFRVEASVTGQPASAGTLVTGIGGGDAGLHWSIKKYS